MLFLGSDHELNHVITWSYLTGWIPQAHYPSIVIATGQAYRSGGGGGLGSYTLSE